MPEYFFHVRLDLRTAACVNGDHASFLQTDIFATPPVLAQTSCNATTNKTGSDQAQDTSCGDWRSGKIVIQSFDMKPTAKAQASAATGPDGSTITGPSTPATAHNSLAKRIANRPGNAATKARFEPSAIHETEAGWGVVRVYRDADETPGLYGFDAQKPSLNPPVPSIQNRTLTETYSSMVSKKKSTPPKDEECNTLCILAVPSYMSPSDFLGWVGETTRDEVSHFRLIRTERANRYMVLMRFRSGRQAREWRKEHNGASFDATAPETAQVVFVKTIDYMTEDTSSFPQTDKPAEKKDKDHTAMHGKPLAPPTPNLVEMPTCPVCLERMDDSTGLLTIQCQHVFHCACLEKWRGRGCPICRFTHDGLAGRRLPALAENPETGPNECNICKAEENLWICLICGNVGCGRYDAAHAFLHWEQTGHAYSMDMTSQRIWSYGADAYVHRIVQNQLDGKLAQKTDSSDNDAGAHAAMMPAGEDLIPREKADALGREYSALLSSQLESQRAYYEDKVSLVADKASKASLAATQAAEAASQALDQLTRLQEEHRVLNEETVPEKNRAIKRAAKASEMAHKFERLWREEKALNEGLSSRVTRLEEEAAQREAVWAPMNKEIQTLRDENWDMQAYICGQAKLAAMGDEAVDGTIVVPDEPAQSAQPEKKKKNRSRANRKKGKQRATESDDGVAASNSGVDNAPAPRHDEKDMSSKPGPSG